MSFHHIPQHVPSKITPYICVTHKKSNLSETPGGSAVPAAPVLSAPLIQSSQFFAKRDSTKEDIHVNNMFEIPRNEPSLHHYQQSPTDNNAHASAQLSAYKYYFVQLKYNLCFRSEEPIISNMDITTGHLILAYMEDHLKNKDRLDREWEALCAYEAEPCSTECATTPNNIKKNRFPNVIPYDHSRVVLTESTNISGSNYINASTITDHDPRTPAYIATQGPLPHTAADFWQMVWEQGSVVIVMLTRLMENGVALCHRYWPEEGSELYHIYEVRIIEGSNYITIIVKLLKIYIDNLHYSDGSGRTGTYCLIDMVLNRMDKEEAKARIQADAKDRAGLRLKLDSCIDPMDSKEHPEGSIVNIFSGKLAPASVNVENAVMIGETMLDDYKKTWPEGFNSTISKKVETMAASCKSVKIGDSKLAPVPTAMFMKDGMWICKAKSKLKRSLQIEVSRRNAGDADTTVIDGSALLWTIHWPADSSVADFIANVKKRIASYLTNSDDYLIFDRYHEYSIKSTTRDDRETRVTRKHHLLRTTKLLAQKVVLSSVENKKQLIRIICEELTEDRLFHLRNTGDHKLVVTGEDPCPIEVQNEERRTRYDLETHQEEADIIIVQQVLMCVGEALINLSAKEIDIAATLEHIRDQRVAMVKTKTQFEYVLMIIADEVHAILKAMPN
ncbi:Receptor-type tyrosine-protein phosphatase-like N [Nymphon striatum]|nr:Receptor-type tyrosine-protein phosphatase-like N [Nymphon striatum]